MGLKSHDGPYTFKEFEKYLYSKYKDLLITEIILKSRSNSFILYIVNNYKGCDH